ncbi:helix-turn-helix domain-containing protein [Halorarius halobius]|uniref:helix-turn-helix domain-containing protein n=1 Tax=Halorarius halobius TaxID=2962671 RepID=UPI0020CF7E85|nr:helix-turn-helix domain-containing protein [Halorarius halobius]
MTHPTSTDGAVHVSLDLWYPDCWELEATEQFDVGLLGYGIYTTGERVTTLFTLHADTQAALDPAVEFIAAHPNVHEVSEMNPSYRQATASVPGNAMRDLLVDHDGRKQITNALMSRGFVCSDPIDIRDGREYWTLATNHDRATVREKLDEVSTERDADINVRSITNSTWQSGASALPTDRLTQRQLEVFRLARDSGYYDYPKEVSAGELADELGISTSTLHEHLHKAEATLLGQSQER